MIAFNCNGECWYNAANDVASAQAGRRCDHWFLTACHELAHNFEKSHGTTFADVNSQIVLRYSDRYRQELSRGR